MMKTIEKGLARFSQQDRDALGFKDRDWNDLANVLVVQRVWFREWLRTDPRPAYHAMKPAALVVFGGSDQQVPVPLNLRPMESAVPTGSTVVRTLENHNHLLQESASGSPAEYGALADPISSKALDLIGGWLRDHLALKARTPI